MSRLEGGGEEKLHYMTFVTFSSLVYEKKFYSINLIKMTKNENKNCKCSKLEGIRDIIFKKIKTNIKLKIIDK